MEAFTTGQPSLLLRVGGDSEPGSVDVLVCCAKWSRRDPSCDLRLGLLFGVRAIEPEVLAR